MDLDDTLLDKQLRIGDADREAIGRAQKAGVKVVLATGRMYRATLPYITELGLDTPAISYQGALVKKPDSGETLTHYPVPGDMAMKIIRAIKPYGYHINLYKDDDLLIAGESPESRLYVSVAGVKPIEVGDLEEFLLKERFDPTKVLAVAEEEQLDGISPELKSLFGEKLHITKSKPHFLEFSHPLANKGHALAMVAEYYGISREEIIAVGDSYNDLEMLDYAGLGVAVGNARDEIKDRADYVTLANTEGGVAHVIQRFITG
ncbi:Cof-like hydrolase [Desulfocucumis palustris]|uniref:Cof-like hydrolase n=2 Tax=Desulfocucumis palustris TaxID=1898651 RepID=A0A2L2XNI8_9FIRM|nr:Cof-like hydrolase [Desulfocucumis palustris]